MQKVLIGFVVILLALLAWTTYDFYTHNKEIREKGTEFSKSLCHQLLNRFDSLAEIEHQYLNKLVDTLNRQPMTANEVINFVERNAWHNPNLMGITVAYLPYKFKDDTKLFAPFYDAKTKTLMDVGAIYDYTKPGQETTVWFTKAIKANHAILTKPYFAKAAQEQVVDFAMAFYASPAKKEKVGVVSVTISLDNFTDFINGMVVGNSGYAFTFDNQGDFITHPNREFILHSNIEMLSEKNGIKNLKKILLSKPEGYVQYKSLYTHLNSVIYFATSRVTRWKIAVVLSKSDINGNPKLYKQKIIRLTIVLSIFLGLVIVLGFKWYQGETHQLWKLSFLVSCLLLLNISVVWLLHLDFDYSLPLPGTTRIYDDTDLQTYIRKKDLDQHRLGHKEFLKIPTGIFIEELEVDESYNVSLSGKVWQRWPGTHDLKDKIGFHFIQAAPYGRSVKINLLSKDTLANGSLLYTWQFDATVKIYFDYSQYPLDQHYVDLKLIYPDLTDDIMLVPDIESYEVLNPSTKPGLSDMLFLPKHRIIASYFSFSSQDMKTFFGQDRSKGATEYQLLGYNIVLKRRFITPFVSFIIPALLGASLIFFLLYSLTKDKEDNSGVTVMGVVQGMVGLFFSLLLAHITIRNRIASPHITYMETFYFAVYIIIVLLIVDVVMFSRNRQLKFILYKDNLLVKLAFWPVWLGVLWIITLIKFY